MIGKDQIQNGIMLARQTKQRCARLCTDRQRKSEGDILRPMICFWAVDKNCETKNNAFPGNPSV